MVLWRHGRTDWNDENRFQGHTDIALNDVGRTQAAQAAQQLTPLQPQLIISSDLSRARATADQLAALVGVDVLIDPDLRETAGRRWEGQRAADLLEDPEYRAWLKGDDVSAGGAESRTEVAERATAALNRTVSRLGDDRVAVLVTHGGLIRCLLGSYLGLPLEHWRIFGGLANCCWSVLEESWTGWRLTEHNARSLPQEVLGDDR